MRCFQSRRWFSCGSSFAAWRSDIGTTDLHKYIDIVPLAVSTPWPKTQSSAWLSLTYLFVHPRCPFEGSWPDLGPIHPSNLWHFVKPWSCSRCVGCCPLQWCETPPFDSWRGSKCMTFVQNKKRPCLILTLSIWILRILRYLVAKVIT